LPDYDDSSFEFIVPAEGGRRFGVAAHGKGRNPGYKIEIAQWIETQKTWSEVPMRLGKMARIKNLLFDTGWVPLICLGAHPAPGGFSFDFMVPLWDEPSPIWRATYSIARECFDLKKLPFNPYDTSRSVQQDEKRGDLPKST
jgi:hypothetical protein